MVSKEEKKNGRQNENEKTGKLTHSDVLDFPKVGQ